MGLLHDARSALPGATASLLHTAYRLQPGDELQRSRCAGWTRAHVLSHLARNADGLGRLVRSAVDGTRESMYASDQERESEIELGASRPLDRLQADLTRTCSAVEAALDRLTDAHAEVVVSRTPRGQTFRAEWLPLLRLREVAIHHVDLDAGYRFADIPDEVVALLLTEQVRRLRADAGAPDLVITTDEGDEFPVGQATTPVSGPRHAVLAWLTRGLSDGVRGDLPTLPHGG